MLERCSTPSSHYWTGNIDWLEQALTLHVKDCVYQHMNGYTNTYMNYTFQSMPSQGEKDRSTQTHRDNQRDTNR